ncbi:hypothetical protein R1flu_017405 [Riccia fluitans]|uniref:Choline kinase n=1 Tax=Riccia fluitans TaxID=41844 RepID=A0ABD1ZCV0_9MARC
MSWTVAYVNSGVNSGVNLSTTCCLPKAADDSLSLFPDGARAFLVSLIRPRLDFERWRVAATIASPEADRKHRRKVRASFGFEFLCIKQRKKDTAEFPVVVFPLRVTFVGANFGLMVALELELGKEMEDSPSKNEDELTLRTEPLDGEIAKDDELDVPEDAYAVLFRLAKNWTGIDDHRNVYLKPLKGAMTNEVYECHWPCTDKGEKPRKVLLRVYGESADLFFSRDDEILTFEKMSQHGQGPRLLSRFSNGRVEEYLNARTLTAADLRNDKITDQIAMKLREFHELDMPGEVKPMLWHRLSSWLGKALELATTSQIQEFRLNQLDDEIKQLEQKVPKFGGKIGFCHNDLQYGNIMMDEDNSSVTIIDYEYASFNPVAFDIANFFCEKAADYHTETPHLLDYTKYPDYESRRRFVATYLQATGETPEEAEIEALVKEAEIYRLPCHLQWGLWGILSAQTSEIEFDYLEYARQRFQQYYLVKSTVL